MEGVGVVHVQVQRKIELGNQFRPKRPRVVADVPRPSSVLFQPHRKRSFAGRERKPVAAPDCDDLGVNADRITMSGKISPS